jgi:hypothetical protein
MKLKVTVAVTALVIVIAAASAAAVGSKSGSGTSDFGLAARISPLEIMIKSGPTLPVHDVSDAI